MPTFVGTIEKTVFGGKGFLHHALETGENLATFLPNGIEGQKVQYSIVKNKKTYLEGRIEEVLENSPFEILESERKNFLPGCAFQNVKYPHQIEIKHKQLEEIFRKFSGVKFLPFVESPHIFGYRNKMEFSCGYKKMTREIVDDKKIWTDEGFALGFHPPQNWAQVVSIPDVFLVSDAINFLRTEMEIFLKERCEAKKIPPPWNALSSKGFWRGIIFRESVLEKKIQINFVVSEGKSAKFWAEILEFLAKNNLILQEKFGKEIGGILQTIHTGKNDAILDPKVSTLFGNEIFTEKLENFVFEISPFSFFQTNTFGAEKLYETVRNRLFAGEEKTDRNILDLFCGTGSIGIFCSQNAKKIVGVEMVEEAVEMAKNNAKKNGIENAEFFAGKVEKILPEILEKEVFDSVIIDPPRSGMHPKAVDFLKEIPVKKMVYVSCNPTTLARDAEFFEAHGWKLSSVQGVDMFPHTPHMEVVAELVRLEE